jgi:hypothetical protein
MIETVAKAGIGVDGIFIELILILQMLSDGANMLQELL